MQVGRSTCSLLTLYAYQRSSVMVPRSARAMLSARCSLRLTGAGVEKHGARGSSRRRCRAGAAAPTALGVFTELSEEQPGERAARPERSGRSAGAVRYLDGREPRCG